MMKRKWKKNLNDGPWLFDNQFLIMRKWKEGIESEGKNFQKQNFGL